MDAILNHALLAPEVAVQFVVTTAYITTNLPTVDLPIYIMLAHVEVTVAWRNVPSECLNRRAFLPNRGKLSQYCVAARAQITFRVQF
jgi:hypothetical protein